LIRIPLDFYLRGQSPLHRCPAIVKLIAALSIVMGIALTPLAHWGIYATTAMILLFLVFAGRLPYRTILLRVLVIEPFVGTVALLSLFQPHGLIIFLGLISKSTLCLLTMVILTATVRFTELLHALRQLRIPAILITILAMMYRYLFLLADDLGRIKRAQESRTFAKQRRLKWLGLSANIAQLFVRTSLRAERVYGAMCARGWSSSSR
jgi:cobalt/nickel transport system permease protein